MVNFRQNLRSIRILQFLICFITLIIPSFQVRCPVCLPLVFRTYFFFLHKTLIYFLKFVIDPNFLDFSRTSLSLRLTILIFFFTVERRATVHDSPHSVFSTRKLLYYL